MNPQEIEWAVDCLNTSGELPCWFYQPEEWAALLPALPPGEFRYGRYVTAGYEPLAWQLKAVA
jgi:hypothetical protein